MSKLTTAELRVASVIAELVVRTVLPRAGSLQGHRGKGRRWASAQAAEHQCKGRGRIATRAAKFVVTRQCRAALLAPALFAASTEAPLHDDYQYK